MNAECLNAYVCTGPDLRRGGIWTGLNFFKGGGVGFLLLGGGGIWKGLNF